MVNRAIETFIGRRKFIKKQDKITAVEQKYWLPTEVHVLVGSSGIPEYMNYIL